MSLINYLSGKVSSVADTESMQKKKETGVSRHNGDPMKNPLNPERFQGGLPRDTQKRLERLYD